MKTHSSLHRGPRNPTRLARRKESIGEIIGDGIGSLGILIGVAGLGIFAWELALWWRDGQWVWHTLRDVVRAIPPIPWIGFEKIGDGLLAVPVSLCLLGAGLTFVALGGTVGSAARHAQRRGRKRLIAHQ